MLGASVSPIVYFSGKKPRSLEGESKSDNHHLRENGKSDQTLYKDTLEHFLGIPPILDSEFPLDYGILFMGLKYRF
jgi:hypothetical protein